MALPRRTVHGARAVGVDLSHARSRLEQLWCSVRPRESKLARGSPMHHRQVNMASGIPVSEAPRRRPAPPSTPLAPSPSSPWLNAHELDCSLQVRAAVTPKKKKKYLYRDRRAVTVTMGSR